MFLFDGDKLVCERVYFDSRTVLHQLGVARDPLSIAGRVGTVVNHPLTIGSRTHPAGTRHPAAEER